MRGEGEAPGSTPLALASGVLVGALAAVSNVYVSLKAGWSLPVMSTAALVGIGAARARGRALAPREAVFLASLASAAGYMAGGGNVAAIPAFVILGGAAPAPAALAVWFAVTAAFGTLAAPLLGGALVDRLRFPTATATATLLETAGPARADLGRVLRRATALAAVLALVRRLAGIPPAILAPGVVGRHGLGLDTSLLLAGVGGLMTPRTAWSTLLGGIVTYGILAPAIVARGIVDAPRYDAVVRFAVWPAAALLVTAALVELALDLPRLLGGPRGASRTHLAARDVLLVVALGAVASVLARTLFGIGWVAAVAALPAALAIAYVAARAMGETDVVPTKALAPLAQLAFGVGSAPLATPALVPNLTSAAALHAADTLGSLKLARLAGTPEREALHARVVGVVLGAVLVVVTYHVVVPDPTALPTTELPAPAVLVWQSVLEATAGGLPGATRTAILAGACAGAILTLAARVLPPPLARLVPSPIGLGSGMVLPATNAVSIALGALVRSRVPGETGTVLASGVVAGESVVGVLASLAGIGR